MTNTTTITTELATEITAQGKKQVEKYFKAIEGAKKSAWNVAKVVSETVSGEKFDDNFGSLGNYATAIKMSKASVSLMNRAYKLYDGNEDLTGFTYSAVSVLLALPAEIEVSDFLDRYDIDAETPVSEIKKKVAEVKALATKGEESDGEESDGESSESGESGDDVVDMVSVPDTDLVYIDGKVWELSAEDVNKVREVLGL